MVYACIDHLYVPTSNLDTATAPFRRLGFDFPPSPFDTPGHGMTSTWLRAGAGTGAVTIQFDPLTNREEALQADLRGPAFVEAVEQGRGLFAVSLGCEEAAIEAAVAALRRRGLSPAVHQLFNNTLVHLHLPRVAAVDLRLLGPLERLQAFRAQSALAPGILPLRRLDHLAAVTPDLDAASAFWTDVLEIPLHGEVRSATSIIRQFKIGDAIIELLGPATPESPLAQRPPGLISMAAFEVSDMADAVAQARAAGFTVADAAPGSLPGTRVTTIPASELSGLALQLLEYV
jgi:catechol 2,3-dioxygenase-like lactoylglutathione lyase family enzyme